MPSACRIETSENPLRLPNGVQVLSREIADPNVALGTSPSDSQKRFLRSHPRYLGMADGCAQLNSKPKSLTLNPKPQTRPLTLCPNT